MSLSIFITNDLYLNKTYLASANIDVHWILTLHETFNLLVSIISISLLCSRCLFKEWTKYIYNTLIKFQPSQQKAGWIILAQPNSIYHYKELCTLLTKKSIIKCFKWLHNWYSHRILFQILCEKSCNHILVVHVTSKWWSGNRKDDIFFHCKF
jgi:hypothetical protein